MADIDSRLYYKMVFKVYLAEFTCGLCGAKFRCQHGEFLYNKDYIENGGKFIYLTCPFCGQYHHDYTYNLSPTPPIEWVEESKVVNYCKEVNEADYMLVGDTDYGPLNLKLTPVRTTVKNTVTTAHFDIVTRQPDLPWSISKSASWINDLNLPASSCVGSRTVTLQFSQNLSAYDSRTAIITVRYMTYVKKFQLKQLSVMESADEGKEPIYVSPSYADINYEAGQMVFTVTTDAQWKPTSDSDDWCMVLTYDTDTFTVKWGQNYGTTPRTANITITGTDMQTMPCMIVIRQGYEGEEGGGGGGGGGDEYSLSVSPTSLSFAAAGETKSFQIYSNTSWSISCPSWLTLSSSIGSNNMSVTATASKNTGTQRTGSITVTGTGVSSQSISVSQAAGSSTEKYLTVNPTSLTEISSGGASRVLTVSSNVNWSVMSTVTAVCTVSPDHGSNNGEVTVTIFENSSNNVRNATVLFSSSELSGVVSVSVSQKANSSTEKYLTVDPMSINKPAATVDVILTITSNTSWAANKPSGISWCTVNPTSGHGNGSVTVTLLENTGSERTTTINFSGDSVTGFSIPVTQAEPVVTPLSVSPTSLSFVAGPGSHFNTIDVTAPSAWTASMSDETWCYITNTTETTVMVSAAQNNSGSERSVTLTITCGSETVTVPITQSAAEAYLTPTKSSLPFNSNSQNTTFSIMSNVDWTVSSNQNWCSVSPSSGSGNGDVTVTVSENTDTQNDRSATITLSNVSLNSVTITVTQTKKSEEPVDDSYAVGLISDIHYCVTGNKKITTEKDGNESGDYGYNSFFREDLNKLIQRFGQAGVEFVASCGDIVTSDVNDLVEFTHDYIKDWTGLDMYSGGGFYSDTNFKPFYCAMGNHDHWAVYSDASYCKYINYGNSIDHHGSRWDVINYNGTAYNCPGQLASLSSGISYADSSSHSYYVVPSGHPNDMFIFLSAFYGDRLPSASNPNYGSKNDMSQMHPHNQLNPADTDVQAMMSYCGKTNIFTSGNETNFNFMYYKPSDLIWLKNTIQANSSKRIFVFSHYFFPQKAGGGNKYDIGSTELMGLTFHFLNKLNNDYPRTIWFSGHSHYSWNDTTYNNAGDIHFCNKDYQYIEPDATDNAQILSNYTSNNWYQQPSGKKLYNRTSSPSVTDSATGWNIHLPSMSRPKESSSIMANCEAAIMEVHSDYVEIYKVGYSTSDGNTYNSYSSNIYYRSLTIQNSDGSGTISGPEPGGGGGGEDPTPGNNQIAFVITNNLSNTVYFTGRLRIQVGDSSSASIDVDGTCSERNFCFRNPRYYPSTGSKYYYNNEKLPDGTHVYTPANKYGYGDNTESLAPGQSMTIIYSKQIDYSSSQGNLKIDGDISALFGKYFVTKDHSSYNPDSSPFYNTSIKLDIAINRSTSDLPNRVDQAASFYHVKFVNNSSNQQIVNQGVYHLVFDRLVTASGWTMSDHPSYTSADVANTSYVTVEYS